jgi:hypothetical protein
MSKSTLRRVTPSNSVRSELARRTERRKIPIIEESEDDQASLEGDISEDEEFEAKLTTGKRPSRSVRVVSLEEEFSPREERKVINRSKQRKVRVEESSEGEEEGEEGEVNSDEEEEVDSEDDEELIELNRQLEKWRRSLKRK